MYNQKPTSSNKSDGLTGSRGPKLNTAFASSPYHRQLAAQEMADAPPLPRHLYMPASTQSGTSAPAPTRQRQSAPPRMPAPQPTQPLTQQELATQAEKLQAAYEAYQRQQQLYVQHQYQQQQEYYQQQLLNQLYEQQPAVILPGQQNPYSRQQQHQPIRYQQQQQQQQQSANKQDNYYTADQFATFLNNQQSHVLEQQHTQLNQQYKHGGSYAPQATAAETTYANYSPPVIQTTNGNTAASTSAASYAPSNGLQQVQYSNSNPNNVYI